MSAGEAFDVLDWVTGRPVGRTVARTRAHDEGVPHGAIHLWIGRRTPPGPALLFQRRADHKESFPGLLDATVGGHLRAGESWREGLRETEEEIGISVDPEACRLVMRRRFEWRRAAAAGAPSTRTGSLPDPRSAFWDREWLDEFALVDDRPLSDYSFPDGEASALVAVPFDGLRRLLVSSDARVAAASWNGRTSSELELTASHFNPNYFSGDLLERVMACLETEA